jgi:dTDP-4-dehydrorhamnose 3,5-epimerase
MCFAAKPWGKFPVQPASPGSRGMNVIETRLAGVRIIEPKVFRDERGLFVESWNQDRYAALGVDLPFVQDNVSFSCQGVLRGLHYQQPTPQGKLITVLQGEVYDVAVDLRLGSPTFGEWVGIELPSESLRQLYVPVGFAHGFVVTSETALVSYKCTNPYTPEHEGSLRWDDPEVGIEWPVRAPILSSRDAAAPLLREIPEERLFSADAPAIA